MKTQITQTLVLILTCIWTVPAGAEYTLILKNGRRITVQSYRDEMGMIKFGGFGGEIGISKDQVQEIRKGDGNVPGDLNLTRREPADPAGAVTGQTQSGIAERPAGSVQRPDEETEYMTKLKNLTEELEAARNSYSEAIRGTTSSEPTQLVTEDQINARQADLEARFKEAQNHPSPSAPVNLVRPSPFSTLPPTTETVPGAAVPPPPTIDQPLTEREKQLTDLRLKTIELEQQRARLIDEMRQKNMNVGSLFLE